MNSNIHNIKYYWIVNYYTYFSCFLVGTSIIHNLFDYKSIYCSVNRVFISELYSFISIMLIILGELSLMKKYLGFLHNIYLNTLFHIFISIILIILELDSNIYSKFTTSSLLIGSIIKLVVIYISHTQNIYDESAEIIRENIYDESAEIVRENSYINNIYPNQNIYDEFAEIIR